MRYMMVCLAAFAVIDNGTPFARAAAEAEPAAQTPPSAAIDPVTVESPPLKFAPDPLAEKDFDKYYYFHRDETSFQEALADLRYCDSLSRGLSSPYGGAAVPYPYAGTLAGAAGGALGNLMAVAIFGSAQLRASRRVNMRRCMNYKGYQRYGLPKKLWEPFNFEEGLSSVEEGRRQMLLARQAKVASGDHPTTPALGR